jgi:hypothetical protein
LSLCLSLYRTEGKTFFPGFVNFFQRFLLSQFIIPIFNMLHCELVAKFTYIIPQCTSALLFHVIFPGQGWPWYACPSGSSFVHLSGVRHKILRHVNVLKTQFFFSRYYVTFRSITVSKKHYYVLHNLICLSFSIVLIYICFGPSLERRGAPVRVVRFFDFQ